MGFKTSNTAEIWNSARRTCRKVYDIRAQTGNDWKRTQSLMHHFLFQNPSRIVFLMFVRRVQLLSEFNLEKVKSLKLCNCQAFHNAKSFYWVTTKWRPHNQFPYHEPLFLMQSKMLKHFLHSFRSIEIQTNATITKQWQFPLKCTDSQ